MKRLVDISGNPLQLFTLYEDKACKVYFDTCWVSESNFQNGNYNLTFQYEDGRKKQFRDLDSALNFTIHLLSRQDSPRYFFETVARAQNIEKSDRKQSEKIKFFKIASTLNLATQNS